MERHWFYAIAVFVFICLLQLYIDSSFQIHGEIKPYAKIYNKPSPANHCEPLKNIRGVLVAINYNFPHYASLPILKQFYENIFGKVVFCGDVEFPGVIKINEVKGYLGYECVATAIRMFPHFSGYFHVNDDVMLNWWNFVSLDMSKIWIGINIFPRHNRLAHVFGEHKLPQDWYWWTAADAARLCEVAFEDIRKLSHTKEGVSFNLQRYFKRYFANTNNSKICVHSWSDVFYIPQEFSKTYARLSQIYRDNNVFLEVAVPGILYFFINETNYLNLNGVYLPSVVGCSKKYYSGEAFYEIYSFDSTFYHPFKLGGGMHIANNNFLKNVVMAHGEIVKVNCLFRKVGSPIEWKKAVEKEETTNE